MTEPGGRVLVVDDNIINRKQLMRLLTDQGYNVTLAEDGAGAVEMLTGGTTDFRSSAPFDVILLDILMPGMDGYEVLAYVKGHASLRHIPVIMISALEEMDSVIRCIELGAADYLPKPFKPALLQARLHACMAEKRLRDLELEYLEQAGKVADAAQEVEQGRFDPVALDPVAAREDALGRLARVFQRMAREVHLREQRLQRQLEQLRLDMNEMRRGPAEPASVWLPRDRQHALVRNESLPDRTEGAALFADISGFTPLTAALTRELGLRRGAEELTRTINLVYNGLVAALHQYGGSVIGFAGDSITCWIDGDDGRRALASGLAMQEAMGLTAAVTTPAGTTFPLWIKIAVVAGPVRRFLAGEPSQSLIEVVAGRTLDRLAAAEQCAARGETLVGAEIVERLGEGVRVAEWRTAESTGERFALVDGLNETVSATPWPELPPDALPDARCQPWLLPAVYERVRSGARQFLADLRPVTALFLNFRGIDYDGDENAGDKLDTYIRWVQSVAERFDGAVIQVTMGDKGSYLAVAFGAPVSNIDDETRAVRCARVLVAPPGELPFVAGTRIGIAAGLARAGAYGSEARRTYGIQGDRINLAARLMQVAPENDILCEETVAQAAGTALQFEALQPILVKGRAEAVPIYRPLAALEESSVPVDAQPHPASLRDRLAALSPSEALVLKVASTLGITFTPDLLAAIFPVGSEKARLSDRLARLEQMELIRKQWPDEVYSFAQPEVQEAAYNGMLFVQRRTLHREIAEWYEVSYPSRLAPYYSTLAHHWEAGEEPAKAVDYLEKAAQRAREDGDLATAEELLQRSMKLEAEAAVLSSAYYGDESQTGAPDYEGAITYSLSRLAHELSPDYRYHSLWHTRDDMLPAVRRLAQMSGLVEADRRLAEVGAAYHDLGFLVDPEDHERAGANASAQILPGFGFDSEQVALIQGIILATRVPQAPRTPLEDIVADADLDSLGRSDYPLRSDALRAENSCFGRQYTDEAWYTRQLRFLLNHSYWSEAARELRNAGKQENIAWLETQLAKLKEADNLRA